MSDVKIQQSMRNLEAALHRLGEALAEPNANPLMVDGTIQRFEFVIELFWKTLKRLLESEHVRAGTPKEVLRQAYQAEWLDQEDIWLAMLQDRNETSHIYNSAQAQAIYQRIRDEYYPVLKATCAFLKQRFMP